MFQNIMLLLLVLAILGTDGDPTLLKGNNSLLFSDHLELSAARLNVRVNFKPYLQTWEVFKSAFDRRYEKEEDESKRYQLFLGNVKMIELHNARFLEGKSTYWMGVNQFSDWTSEEYRTFAKGLRRAGKGSETAMKCTTYSPPLDAMLPAHVDWRSKGYVTPVKNQGQCGSCWAFSTTGALEGQNFRRTGQLISLSEQQLVDCASAFGPQGCGGGWEYEAYAYINYTGGLEDEQYYPYQAQDERCEFYKPYAMVRVAGCRSLSSGSEKQLQQAVAAQGPISVNIDATLPSFMNYQGGLYVEDQCRNTLYDLDHAVLAVGYGSTAAGQDYWIVKNSWSRQWGEQGYIRMARNYNNMCGIATTPTFPIV